MYKLKAKFGIQGTLLDWISSLLSIRRQRVKIGTEYSEWAQVKSGVPQGSVLAPLFFILYVADMQENLSNIQVGKFADDTKLYSDNLGPESQLNLQENLVNLSRWLKNWKMLTNVKKTAVFKFGKLQSDEAIYMKMKRCKLVSRSEIWEF